MIEYTRDNLKKLETALSVIKFGTNVTVTPIISSGGRIDYFQIAFRDPRETGPTGMRRPKLTVYSSKLSRGEAERYIRMQEMIEKPERSLILHGNRLYGFSPTQILLTSGKLILTDNPPIGMGEHHSIEVEYETAKRHLRDYFAKGEIIDGIRISLTNAGITCANYELLYNSRVGLDQVRATQEQLETVIKSKPVANVTFNISMLGQVNLNTLGISDVRSSPAELKKGR